MAAVLEKPHEMEDAEECVVMLKGMTKEEKLLVEGIITGLRLRKQTNECEKNKAGG